MGILFVDYVIMFITQVTYILIHRHKLFSATVQSDGKLSLVRFFMELIPIVS